MLRARSQRGVKLVAAMLGIAVVGAACSSVKAAPPPLPAAAPVVISEPVVPVSAAAVIAKVNEVRAANGLPAYASNGLLGGLAQDWSAYMASTDQFVHRDLQEAIEQPEFADFQQIGENILRGGCTLSADDMVSAWMSSPGHRDNLLSTLYELIGIGVVCGNDGRVWVTQNFGVLR